MSQPLQTSGSNEVKSSFKGVMFFKKPEGEEMRVTKIRGNVKFKPKEGDVEFHFEPVRD